MNLARVLGAIMGAASRRPLVVGLVVGVLALAGGGLALTLRPSAATDTLVGRSTASFRATERFHERFGDDAVYVLVREPVTALTLTADIQRVLGLEGCISGNVPRGIKPPGGPNGPCAALARGKQAKVVFGPGTFLNEAVGRIAEELSRQAQAASLQAQRAARAARARARARGADPATVKRAGDDASRKVQTEFTRGLIAIAVRYGLGSNPLPQLDNPAFIARIVFDSSKKPAGTPKARFAYLFPNRSSALIQVRLRPDLTEAQRKDAIALVRRAIAMPEWRLPNGKGSYVVTGAPVVVADLTSAIGDAILLLLVAALVVMALTLAVVFRARMRLLPLAVALAATGLTFGLLAAVGAPLTMASIGVLPVLIGLAVDYAIQLQARVQERENAGREVHAAVAGVAVAGAPTVVTAAAATAVGFLALSLSPVPMVRAFGLLLVAGIFLAVFCALSLGTAALVAGAGQSRAARLPAPLRAAADALGGAWRGAEEIVRDSRVAGALAARATRAGRGSLRAARERPGRVLAVAASLAVVGWALDTQTNVESDVQKLVPQNLAALRDLQTLQRATDVGGEIDVMVTSDRLTDPSVVSWMTSYQGRLLRRFGYSAQRGCGRAELCPAFSLPDLLSGTGSARTENELTALLDAVPAYFSQGVITSDRRTATLAFGIRLMPLDRQQQVIEAMRSALHPPPGVHAELAGLPVLAAEANDRVSSPWRRALTLLAGLLAVFAVLMAAFRRWERALIPLVPIALATGWSALVLFLLRIPLNPMSVTLGSLVIAVSTEFSVLLAERYRQERAAGNALEDALRRTYQSTGAAVLASGTTAIAGFAVLALSDIRMLRDFGIATVVDLTVSLLGVMVVLPAVLVVAERKELALGRREGVRARRAPAA